MSIMEVIEKVRINPIEKETAFSSSLSFKTYHHGTETGVVMFKRARLLVRLMVELII